MSGGVELYLTLWEAEAKDHKLETSRPASKYTIKEEMALRGVPPDPSVGALQPS